MLEILLASAALQDISTANSVTLPAGSCIMAASSPGGLDNPELSRVDGSKLIKVSDLKKIRGKKSKAASPVIVDGGVFTGWQLKKLKLQNVCFVGSDFTGSDWSRVQASGLGFIRTNLAGANLGGAQIPYSIFRESDLSTANFSGANLDGGLVDGGWSGSLSGTKFDGAFMRSFRFVCGNNESDGCSFDRQGLSFKGANLSQAQISTFAFWDADLSGAQLGGASVSLGQLNFLNESLFDSPVNVVVNGQAIAATKEEVAELASGIKYGEGSADAPWCAPGQSDVSCPLVGKEVIALHDDVSRLSEGKTTRSDKRAQTAFEKARSVCMDSALEKRDVCLQNLYWERRETLIAQSGQPDWLNGQSIRIYAASDITILPSAATREIFQKVTPALLESMTNMVVLRSEKKNFATARLRSAEGCGISAENMIYLPRAGRMARSAGKGRYKTLFSVSDDVLTWSRSENLSKESASLDCEDKPLVLKRINVSPDIANLMWIKMQSSGS